MIGTLVRKIVGTRNSRELKRMSKLMVRINALAEDMNTLTDSALQAKSTELKQRAANGESLDALLPEAFALCREASERTLGMRHFDVQLIGGITLHEGKIAEMRTGEGKTLVATLPAYLNALGGKAVHLVTVNDYLARRDANWMRPLYEFLGMSVGINVPGMRREEKMAAYAANIVYGTNNEFGFDYLRDNMAISMADKMQRELAFAIVDEVDSILIDEARTPLIISGASEDHSPLYRKINTLIPSLRPMQHPDLPRGRDITARRIRLQEADDAEPVVVDLEQVLARAGREELELVQVMEGKEPTCKLVPLGHYLVDEKTRQIELTELGHQVIEDMLVREGLLRADDSLYASSNLSLLHHVTTGLRAHVIFHRDVDYIVEQGQVVLIDEHTGRKMEGRRLSEGLHQAIEAKEGVKIQAESQTLASTTFQNFFRLYKKLAGMTGTADTEAAEFHQIYGLTVVVIPTNLPVNRSDLNDLIFLTKEEKFEAIIEDILSCREKGAPVLVGTASIESSEELSRNLKKRGIKHEVLNAKHHAREAEIIAQAGRPGAVTIATNMAGRGTDIVLGGNVEAEIARMPEPTEDRIKRLREEWQQAHAKVLEAGGLHVLGTERHESRRIDNQLRGRAGRQGDPGVSRFYLSLEDDLMRIFASDRVKNFMQAMGMEKGEAIEHRMVTNAIEKAQRRVEGRNFDIRKQLLEYDDVANDQRQIIYHQRDTLLEEDDVSGILTNIRAEVVNEVINEFVPPGSIFEQWDIPALERHLETEFHLQLPVQKWLDEDERFAEEQLRERVVQEAERAYQEKAASVGLDMRRIEKLIMLQILDQMWKEHLAAMDHLRYGIQLRSYAQKNPKQEYKRESYALFEKMLSRFRHDTISFLAKVQIRMDDAETLEQQRREEEERKQMQLRHDEVTAATAAAVGEEPQAMAPEPAPPRQPVIREGRKVGRNDPCPCGSGKKYKQCHGAIA